MNSRMKSSEVGVLMAIQAQVRDTSMASVQIDKTFVDGADVGFQLQDQTVTAESDLGSVTINDGQADLAADFTSVEASMSLGFPGSGSVCSTGQLGQGSRRSRRSKGS